MPATLSTVSRLLFRMSLSVLNPHLSLNRKPNTACKKTIEELDKWDIKKGEQRGEEYMEIRNMNGTNRPSFRRRVLIEHLAHIKGNIFSILLLGK